MTDTLTTTVLTDMIGRTAISVQTDQWKRQLVFLFDDGAEMKFYHVQDCCEEVYIEDICGDLADLVGNPLLVAEERVGRSTRIDPPWRDSQTWTFYTFRTVRGSVDVRWLGQSNGYYSESVDYVFTPARQEAA